LKNTIACRTWQYREIVAESKINALEIPFLLTKEKLEEVKKELEKYKLSISSATVNIDLTDEEGPDLLEETYSLLKKENIKYVFTSTKSGDHSKETAYENLKKMGETARRHNLTVGVETHPDLAYNADVALETMQAVDHPNTGINFDTANIYFYNRNTDSVSQIQKILPHVVSVHLKDTEGGYKSPQFPPLGQGIVNFPEIVKILKDNNYTGPYTLEIEGSYFRNVESKEKRKEIYRNFLNDSLEYLEKIDLL